MRLFVALPLPEALRERLAGLSHGLPGARWVAPETLHLTLRFIGEVDGRQAHDIDSALAQVRMPAFPVTLAGLGRFGNGDRLRALWVGVDSNPELERLHDKVEIALQRAGLAPESRKFKGHVTLARFKSNPGPRLHDYLAQHALIRSESFDAGEFVLFSSLLGHGGAIHTPEATYPLERPATAQK